MSDAEPLAGLVEDGTRNSVGGELPNNDGTPRVPAPLGDEPMDGVDDEPPSEPTEVARSSLDAGGAVLDDDLAAVSGIVDVATLYDEQARHTRPSRFGRIDLSIAWRRSERIGAELATNTRRDELWLVGTWRH